MSDNRQQFPMKKDYDFTFSTLFKRAFKLSELNNWVLAQALLCIVAITTVIYLIFFEVYEFNSIEQLLDPENGITQTQQLSIKIVIVFVLSPLWTGVNMLAIFFVRKQKAKTTDIFWYYKLLPQLVVASLLISIFLNLGVALFLLPGFYVFTATTFTLPLMADKKLGPISAIIYSVRVVNMHLQKMLLLFLLFFIMMIVVVLSLGFAYLWIGPLYFNVKAILYQDLFCNNDGNDQHTDGKEKVISNNKGEGVFDA